MTAADRDLVSALRAELAAIDPSRACDRAAERAGLEGASGPRDPVVARLAFRLDRRDPGRPAGDPGRASPGPPVLDFPALPEHCRMAYLRGRFLARGSLSLAGGRTHLEFVLPPDEAPTLAGWLSLAGLPASWRLRRGRGVVTWKSGETVGLFLQRSVAAAGRQLAAIELLDADGRLGAQPHVVRLVADGRRETPEATLTELAERLSLHRSAVQRVLDRLERLALDEAKVPTPPLA
jgi:hypothetical protein